MKRYTVVPTFERHIKVIEIEKGIWVKAEIAQELYDALEELVKQSNHPNISGWVNIERAISALARARGES